MNTLTISADQGTTTISRHIYGHFSEHLGRCIYGGFWNEDDTYRTEAIEALKEIQIPNLRWPGGCFADEYHWRDGIGPRESRPTMINTHWGGVTENNHFGTHEFMELCEHLGCEPYVCGNVGSGTVQEMADWVEYLTFDGVSPRADERRKNGREAQWSLKYWGVGNESWGCGGNMRAEYYAEQYRRYATYCRNYGGNSLYKIACGPNSGDYHWTETMMKQVPRHMMQGLSLHYYAVDGGWPPSDSATEFGEEKWFRVLQSSLKMKEFLEKHGAIMDVYDPERKVSLIVDEWGTWYAVEPGTNPGFLYQQNSLRDALVAGLTLNLFHHHAHRVHMANLAQTINVLQAVLLTEGTKIIKTPTYHVFDLYKVHQDATLVPTHLTTTDYTFGDAKMPALSVSASRNAEGKVHVSICNTDPNQVQTLKVELRGGQYESLTGRLLTADSITAHNTFDAPEVVTVQDMPVIALANNEVTIDIPAHSVITFAVD